LKIKYVGKYSFQRRQIFGAVELNSSISEKNISTFKTCRSITLIFTLVIQVEFSLKIKYVGKYSFQRRKMFGAVELNSSISEKNVSTFKT
jgi:hypothetical protein